MNEFYEEVKEKKSLVPSARRKVSGVRSKRCSLPSDHLTEAQRRKLNGPVRTYAINKPMTWAEFKRLPDDLQQAHLDYIQNRFCVGASHISELVFSRSASTLAAYKARHGLHMGKADTARPSQEILDALCAWVRGEEEPPVVSDEPGVCADPAPVSGLLIQSLVSGTVLRLRGGADELAQALREVLDGRAAELEVSICFLPQGGNNETGTLESVSHH